MTSLSMAGGGGNKPPTDLIAGRYTYPYHDTSLGPYATGSDKITVAADTVLATFTDITGSGVIFYMAFGSSSASTTSEPTSTA